MNNANVPVSCKIPLCLTHFCILNLKGMWHHNVLFLSLSSSSVDTALMSIGVHVADLRPTRFITLPVKWKCSKSDVVYNLINTLPNR